MMLNRWGVTTCIVRLRLHSDELYLLILPSTYCVCLSDISMLTHPSDIVHPPLAAHLPPPSHAHPSPPSHPCPSLPVIPRTDLHSLGHMLDGVSVRSYPPASVLPDDFLHPFIVSTRVQSPRPLPFPTSTSFTAFWARLLHMPLLSAQEVPPFLLTLPSFSIAHLVSFPAPVRMIRTLRRPRPHRCPSRRSPFGAADMLVFLGVLGGSSVALKNLPLQGPGLAATKWQR
jgi:hypothetical protein